MSLYRYECIHLILKTKPIKTAHFLHHTNEEGLILLWPGNIWSTHFLHLILLNKKESFPFHLLDQVLAKGTWNKKNKSRTMSFSKLLTDAAELVGMINTINKLKTPPHPRRPCLKEWFLSWDHHLHLAQFRMKTYNSQILLDPMISQHSSVKTSTSSFRTKGSTLRFLRRRRKPTKRNLLSSLKMKASPFARLNLYSVILW